MSPRAFGFLVPPTTSLPIVQTCFSESRSIRNTETSPWRGMKALYFTRAVFSENQVREKMKWDKFSSFPTSASTPESVLRNNSLNMRKKDFRNLIMEDFSSVSTACPKQARVTQLIVWTDANREDLGWG